MGTALCRRQAARPAAWLRGASMLAVVVLLSAVSPSAYADVTAVTASAYGYLTDVSLFGGPSQQRGPAPTVSLADDASNSPQDGHVDGAEAVYGPAVVFRSGAIDVHAEATLGAGASVTTSADVRGHPDPEQRPGPFLYDRVQAACDADESGVQASVAVDGGVVETRYDPDTQEPVETETVPASPAPGHTVEGTIDHVGDRFRIVFNEQTTNADGSVTVTAAHMYLLGPTAVGDVIIGRTVCGVAAGATPPPGGLVDGGRLDGGGQGDPVGQAIATSQALFADGAAPRVVLATADRFPDALAGAALAGASGPILLTSGLGALDARVEAEVRRVTGGDGVVLTLGGSQAVSETAATQARAAAGDRACSAPLPASCRYAGSGREHTAALIAETVLAEHGGDRVLVARGDEFADAITGGAYAARAGEAILLTPSDQLNAHTADFLREHAIGEAVVLGGTAAVDESTFQALPVPAKRRVAGAERTATAAAIATQLWPGSAAADGGVLLVNVRHPDGWQTALTAAVAAALRGAPQLGVETPPAGLSAATRDALGTLSGPVIAFGDPALVSDAQISEARAARTD